MKKFALALLGVLVLLGCGDGDLQIEIIDFNDIAIQSCDNPVAPTTTLLFKIDSDEALILELQAGVLNNGVVGETVITESPVGTSTNESSLTFRFFSGAITANYFCDDIPPATPVVVEEVIAQDGGVIIETTANAEGTNFIHTINLSGITLINDIGERITNLAIDEFGEVSTVIPAAPSASQ